MAAILAVKVASFGVVAMFGGVGKTSEFAGRKGKVANIATPECVPCGDLGIYVAIFGDLGDLDSHFLTSVESSERNGGVTMLVWDGHNGPVTAIAFDPVTGAVASGDRSGLVLVRQSAGQPFLSNGGTDEKPEPVHSIAYRPDGQIYWASGKVLKKVTSPLLDAYGFAQPVAAMQWLSPTILAVGCGDNARPQPGNLVLWNDTTKRTIEPRHMEPAGVRAVSVLPEFRLVAWANGSRLAKVWDTAKPDAVPFSLTHNASAISLAPDAAALAVTADRAIRVFEIAGRRERWTAKGHGGQVTSLLYHPDGRTLVSGSWDGTVRMWDAATGRPLQVFNWPLDRVTCLAFAADGLRLAAGGDTGRVVVWDVE